MSQTKRRDFLKASGVALGAALASTVSAQRTEQTVSAQRPAPADSTAPAENAAPADGTAPPRAFPGSQPPVVVPNGATLPLREVGGVKVGHLIAEEIDHEFAPGMRARCWGYNGRTPGPMIEATQGDRLRIYVTNRLPEPTTVHWHGLILPSGMDGVAGLNQAPIAPGETWVYEFELRHAGTFMYHSHYDEMTQIALGMAGMFVVHPRRPRGPRVDRDFALMLHEFKIDPGERRPDPNEMSDFNVVTFNSKIFPATDPLLVGKGERVRIRLGNLGPMDHHPIHLHGVNFKVTATDGGEVPASAQRPETTVLVPVGATRVIEFVPTELGDWAMHCHMTHHVMTQMGHDVPSMVGAQMSQVAQRMRRILPDYMPMGERGMGGMGEMEMPIPDNSLPMRGGAGPYSYIDMGGMFTVMKVREDARSADPRGWYSPPEGTQAAPASEAQLRADGIEIP